MINIAIYLLVVGAILRYWHAIQKLNK